MKENIYRVKRLYIGFVMFVFGAFLDFHSYFYIYKEGYESISKLIFVINISLGVFLTTLGLIMMFVSLRKIKF